MESMQQSSIKLSLVEDINCLASIITTVMNDKTIEMEAKGIALVMLLSFDIPLEKAIALMLKPGATRYINKLLDCESDFLGPTPRSVGIDLVSSISADKIQQSLDVKHIKKNQTNYDKLDRSKPQIKIDLAHSYPNTIWVRFYSKHENITFNSATIRNYNILTVCPNVYEIYCDKDPTMVCNVIKELEKSWSADIIFCSELPLFLYSPLLFLSNYVKFMWCYSLNRNVFDPRSTHDHDKLASYLTYGLTFLQTTNLANMPKDTHNPLIACTGERPKIAIAKFDKGKTYINEGSRALQTMNKASDFGTKSNFIETITTIDLDTTVLDNIV